MPFYTFKCPLCEYEEEVLQSFDSAEPICEKCAKASCSKTLIEMKRVFKVNAKPHSKDGSWEFKKEKKEKPK